jgi:ABC-type uncharacterized transport system ATPase subunit
MAAAIPLVKDMTISFDGIKAADGLRIRFESNVLRAMPVPIDAGETTLPDMMCGKPLTSSGSIGLPRVAASDKLKILTPNQHDVWSLFFQRILDFMESKKMNSRTQSRTPIPIAARSLVA